MVNKTVVVSAPPELSRGGSNERGALGRSLWLRAGWSEAGMKQELAAIQEGVSWGWLRIEATCAGKGTGAHQTGPAQPLLRFSSGQITFLGLQLLPL